MSVSALDHLLLSVAGRPSPLAASRKRDARPTHDLLVPFRQRLLFQGSTIKHTRKRQQSNAQKRQHATIQKPQPALSLRLYGLKKNAWPRTLLSVLRIDVDQLDTAHAFSTSRRSLVSSDSKVRLFFDGLVLGKAPTHALSRSLWRLPSAKKLVGKSHPVLQVALEPPHHYSTNFQPSVGIPIDREIGHVRSRRKSLRRMSLISRRSQRSLSNVGRDSCQRQTPMKGDKEEARGETHLDRMWTQESAQLDRIEAAIETARANAMRLVAAEANAQLSFELMERKASHKTEPNTPRDDDSVDSQPSWTESAETEAETPALRDELEMLRVETTEQRALIRQLLLENQRLWVQQQQIKQEQHQPQQQQHQHQPQNKQANKKHQQQQQQIKRQQQNRQQQEPQEPQWIAPDPDVPTPKRKRPSDPHHRQQQRHRRSISSASTDSSSSLEQSRSRPEKLVFGIVDNDETCVDQPTFDQLVAKITSELAELLSDDDFPPVTVDSSGTSGLIRCV